MKNDKISVIIPVYNVEKYLRKCIDSVINQTYHNLEIILIDDGSLDNCGSICDEYCVIDERIRVIHKSNGGLSDARNAGLDIACGEYIGFVDSDDWIDPEMFEQLHKDLKSTGKDISVCGYLREYEQNKLVRVVGNDTHENILLMTPQEAMNELLEDDIIRNHMWNKLYRAKIFENVRFPLGRNFEDVLIQYKLFEKAKNGASCIIKNVDVEN